VQPIVVMAKIPADPGVTHGALPGRRREAQQRQPLPCQVAIYHRVCPIFGNAPR
jgi:hypothetical protein